jgi:hypothetical protein
MILIISRYRGIPMMILKGKVKAKAIETYKLGFASGTVILMAAGTAI